jgi:hypothetical protein
MTRYLWSLAAVVPLTAFAQNDNAFQCTLGGNVRRVEIVYETGVAVPCEVHYYKDTEAPGAREVLWSAQNQSGYCESRTRDFVAQLQSWGWRCEGGTAATAPPAVADDTDVLSAPDDNR